MSPIRNAGVNFNTESRLKHVQCPVMILHAHDDETVPFLLTKRLLVQLNAMTFCGESAYFFQHRTREHGVHIQLHEFPTSRRYGHSMIYQAPELPTLITCALDSVLFPYCNLLCSDFFGRCAKLRKQTHGTK